ncbi:MAG: hypothetical protein K2X38_25460 [Gemmataceae bacterium]|nr:hypothetical protein [Gemmataceae bacterium]
MATVNITPTTPTDGLPYAVAKALTTTEASLQTTGMFDPVPVQYGLGFVAVVQLTIAGTPGSNSTYVVLQTDLGDGVWVDVAWAVTTSTSNGTLTFVLAGGAWSANAVAFTRATGTAPGSNGSNAIPLGGRCRIVGKATVDQGSVTANIRYKLVAPA